VITSLVNPTKFYKSKAENKDHVASKFFKSWRGKNTFLLIPRGKQCSDAKAGQT
jgi:hypothetical protein